MSSNDAGKRKSLLTLGTAAVIAVYTAGYARTRGAADVFAAETAGHRPPHFAATTSKPAQSKSAVPKPATEAERTDSIAVAAIAGGVMSPGKPMHGGATTAKKSLAKRVASSKKKTPSAARPTVVASAAPAPVAPAPATSEPTPPATSPAEAPKAAEPARGPYKDGVYRGYGTSRHGDIEAEIEIKDGRIAAAKISQCLTRYSCSWISQLPGQVVARQSAEVDYVSGATQSSDAFYLAVAEAIGKAK